LWELPIKTNLVTCSLDMYCNFKLPVTIVTSHYDCVERVGQALKEIAYSNCNFEPYRTMDPFENNQMHLEDSKESFH